MDEKYLFYENQGGHVDSVGNQLLLEGNRLWFWNDRLILVEHNNDDEFWRFIALDLITDETRPVYFPKSQSNFRRVRITPLTNDFGFIVERSLGEFCVNLVKLKWAPGEFQLIERFEQAGQFPEIIVNCLSPTKFVLQYYNDNDDCIHKMCTLDSGKIEVIGTYNSGLLTSFEHYFDGKLFGGYNQRIFTYDWETTEEKSVEIKALTNGRIDRNRTCWVKDRLYLATRFNDANGTRKYGIAYTDLETKRWTSIDFEIDMRISRIQYFDGSLIVYTNNADDVNPAIYGSTYSNEFKVYSVQIQCSQSLRKMAWPLVVQGFKRDESITDPYQAAAQFLPFNCDLRPPWYKDETALENLDKPESNEQSQDQSEATSGKTSESKLSQELPDAVPSKRSKFD